MRGNENLKISFCVVYFFPLYPNNGKKLLSLYPTMVKNLFRCIPQRQKNVKHKWLHEKKIFCEMILTHESGSQEDQFDEKNGGQKSRDTIPLNC